MNKRSNMVPVLGCASACAAAFLYSLLYVSCFTNFIFTVLLSVVASLCVYDHQSLPVFKSAMDTF